MGNSLSHWATVQVCAHAKQPVDCPSNHSKTTQGEGYASVGGFKSNADIAGIGVCYAFIITVFLTLGVTSILVLCKFYEFRTKSQRGLVRKGRKLLEAVIVSFSDQQMVTGLSLVITTRFFVGCSISAYHYDIVCNLVLMSVATHLCSITFITEYFHHLWLGIARIVLIVLTFLFALYMLAERNNPGFPTGKPNYDPTDSTRIPYLTSPAACFMSSNVNITNTAEKAGHVLNRASHASGFVEYVIFFTFAPVSLLLRMISSFVTSREHPRWWESLLWCFRVLILPAASAIAIAATLQFWHMRTWMRESKWPADTAEYDWTFGQFLPLLLLMLSGLEFIKAFGDLY